MHSKNSSHGILVPRPYLLEGRVTSPRVTWIRGCDLAGGDLDRATEMDRMRQRLWDANCWGCDDWNQSGIGKLLIYRLLGLGCMQWRSTEKIRVLGLRSRVPRRGPCTHTFCMAQKLSTKIQIFSNDFIRRNDQNKSCRSRKVMKLCCLQLFIWNHLRLQNNI